jgi:hypothetical protein
MVIRLGTMQHTGLDSSLYYTMGIQADLILLVNLQQLGNIF